MGFSEVERKEEMKRYIYCEMDKTEQASIEKKILEDDSYFDDLESLENDLIHQYARNELVSGEKIRFEKNLTKDMNRKAKVANAMALQDYSIENKSLIAPFLENNAIEPPSFFAKIKDFFGFNHFSMQYALGSLVLLLAVSLGFLLYRNYQANQEISRLQKENQEQSEKYNNLQNKENDLQIKANELQVKENELTARTDKVNQKESELTKTNEELTKIKNEISEIRRQKETIAEEIRQNQEKLQNLPKKPIIEQKTTILAVVFPIAKGNNPEIKTENLRPTDAYVEVTLPTLVGGYQAEVDGKIIKSRKIKNNDVLIIPRKHFKAKATTVSFTDSVGNPLNLTLVVNK